MLKLRSVAALVAVVALACSAGTARAQEGGTITPASPPAAEPRKEVAAAPNAASVDTMAVYEVSQLTTKPELANRTEVASSMSRHYPPALRNQGITGNVTVAAVIGRDGRVEEAHVASAPRMDFAEASVAVVRIMRFKPGKVGDVPVRVRIEMPVTFAVESRE